MKKFIQLTLAFSLTLFFSFTFVQTGNAQDPQFSQFYAAPTQTNPALLGVFNGRFRVNLNYRDQWSSIINTSPFRTIGGSFEMRHAIGRNDFLSYGVTVLRDEAGTSHFTRNTGNLGFSYMKKIGGGGYSDQKYITSLGNYLAGNASGTAYIGANNYSGMLLDTTNTTSQVDYKTVSQNESWNEINPDDTGGAERGEADITLMEILA